MNTIGTDPEMFLCDSTTGVLMPVCGLLGGTKGAAIDIGQETGLQEDNVMVEFNIPPQTDPNKFAQVVRTSRQAVLTYCRKAMPGATLYPYGEALFEFGLLKHPQAMTFGCSPDFDAYQHGSPCAPVDPEELNDMGGAWRFAGGHVHIGYEAEDVPDFVAASFADLFIGLWATRYDRQPHRRALYGQPGRFRPTSYGIEYRTLSNFWIVEAEDYAKYVGQQALGLADYLSSTPVGEIRGHFKEIPWADVKAAIENEDYKMAGAIRSHVKKQFGIAGV